MTNQEIERIYNDIKTLQKELDEFILKFAYTRNKHSLDLNELKYKCEYFISTAKSFQQEYNELNNFEDNILQDKITQIIRNAIYSSDLIDMYITVYVDNI